MTLKLSIRVGFRDLDILMNPDNDTTKADVITTGDKVSLENALQGSEETLEITINKVTNEVTLKTPKDNRIIKLKANFEDAIDEKLEEDEDEIAPLTPEDFADGVRRLGALGLTFSVDLFPSVISKNESSSVLIDANEFKSIRDKYPNLPREVGLVSHNTLTGAEVGLDLLGGSESFKRKSEIAKEFVITNDYRADFFFKHALKVPYFESIDWEVILKTHEKGVKEVVSIPYALLMLTFHNTNSRIGQLDRHQNVTVAVNRDLIDKMLATLTEVRAALEESHQMRDILHNTKTLME